jgi:hypothetical protein
MKVRAPSGVNIARVTSGASACAKWAQAIPRTTDAMTLFFRSSLMTILLMNVFGVTLYAGAPSRLLAKRKSLAP